MLSSRRELIAFALNAAALPDARVFLSPWLQASDADGHSHGGAAAGDESRLRNYQAKFFDAEDFEALRAVTCILIPTDENPGAREAYCAEFIDFVLDAADQFSPGHQESWRHAMAALREAGFHAANSEERAHLVELISAHERDGRPPHAAYSAYQLIKRENTFAFYTSRAGLIQTLDYKGNSYNAVFPACDHAEHHVL